MVERKTLNLVVVGSSPTVGDGLIFLFLFFSALDLVRVFLQTCKPFSATTVGTRAALLPLLSSTQGSVQIELIFRLLLKITVDWPSYAINRFL